MNINQTVKLLIALNICNGMVHSQNGSNCYYTDVEVCLPAGTIIWQQRVTCYTGSRWATLFDQDYLEADSYRPVAHTVNPQHTSGFVNKISASILIMVSYGTRRVDPNTCNITITPNAGIAVFYCYGEAADPNSAECGYVEVKSSLTETYYCFLNDEYLMPLDIAYLVN